MAIDNSLHSTVSADVADRLNNVLTGIALKAGVLKLRVSDQSAEADLKELEALALEAVALLRQLVPAPGDFTVKQA